MTRKISRTRRVVVVLAFLALFVIAACSVLFDHNGTQCTTDTDCEKFAGHPTCTGGVCVPSGLGPDGCFFGTPMAQTDFENQCSTSECQPFDNCARLNICDPDGGVPPMVPPPPIDASTIDAAVIDAPTPPTPPPCLDSSRNTVVVGGSTAIAPFLAVIAPLLAANSPAYSIAYQPSGSCTGVDGLFSPDPTKHVIKDIVGKQAVLYKADGTTSNCTFGAGTTLDVAASDVFASSCTSTYATSSTLAEYLALIQPMTFVVPSTSTETSISADMAHVVFGRGNTDASSMPYTDPSLYFIRNSGSGTQQMMSRAINVDPKMWWGKDRGSSTGVRDQIEAVDPARSSEAIGIVSTDIADPVRSSLRELAFQATGQTCGYLPDSTEFTHDKRNVRDGHYAIWGPEHFFAVVSGGIPNPAAAAFVTRFSLPRLDQSMLDAIIKSGLVPQCAMKVQRTIEMGPISTFSPEYQCGCYFEATVTGGAAPPECHTCTGPADCTADTPACNNGYCEVR